MGEEKNTCGNSCTWVAYFCTETATWSLSCAHDCITWFSIPLTGWTLRGGKDIIFLYPSVVLFYTGKGVMMFVLKKIMNTSQWPNLWVHCISIRRKTQSKHSLYFIVTHWNLCSKSVFLFFSVHQWISLWFYNLPMHSIMYFSEYHVFFTLCGINLRADFWEFITMQNKCEERDAVTFMW